MATKKDIIAELDVLEVDYDPNDLKTDLQDLLDVALAEVDTEASDAAPTVGPTGLCRQCNKPADHIHAGV